MVSYSAAIESLLSLFIDSTFQNDNFVCRILYSNNDRSSFIGITLYNFIRIVYVNFSVLSLS